MKWILGLLVGLGFAFAIVFALLWLLWWLWKRRDAQEAPVIEIEVPTPARVVEVPTMAEVETATPTLVAETPEPVEEALSDDLKLIEGIGPKISSVLQAAGITTFAQLADTPAGRIEQILEEESPRLRRLADPTTWPEQAGLAAAGNWEALEALQGELKGGRRA
jgi:predicted flap endonuclease-1-like 5' DNA nuclease